MKTNDTENKRNVYRFANMSVLQIMGVLAVLGLVATWVLRSFFPV